MSENQCEVCGAKGLKPLCDERRKNLASIESTYEMVRCCWNCRHRLYAGARDRSLGSCNLTDAKNVPPDGFCEQHKDRRQEQ